MTGWTEATGALYGGPAFECQLGELPALPGGTPATTLFLEVEEEDPDAAADSNEHDQAGDGDPRWGWRFGISEEDAGFGEATIDEGTCLTAEDAQTACIEAAVEFVRQNGWSETQLARCLPR